MIREGVILYCERLYLQEITKLETIFNKPPKMDHISKMMVLYVYFCSRNIAFLPDIPALLS